MDQINYLCNLANCIEKQQNKMNDIIIDLENKRTWLSNKIVKLSNIKPDDVIVVQNLQKFVNDLQMKFVRNRNDKNQPR